jgi:hypothetical protein
VFRLSEIPRHRYGHNAGGGDAANWFHAVKNILGGSKCTSTTWSESSAGTFVVKFRANHQHVYAQISVFINPLAY